MQRFFFTLLLFVGCLDCFSQGQIEFDNSNKNDLSDSTIQKLLPTAVYDTENKKNHQPSNDELKGNDTIKSLNVNSEDNSKCNCVPHIQEITGFWKWFLIFSPLTLLTIFLLSVRLSDFNFQNALLENDQPKRTIKNPEFSLAAVIALGDSVPNLPSLMPTTIEVSQSWPSLYDLLIIVQIKEQLLKYAEEEYEKANADLKQSGDDAAQEIKDRVITTKQILDVAKKENDTWKTVYEMEAKYNNRLLNYNELRKPSISRYIAFITFLLAIAFILYMSCFFIYYYINTGCPPEFGALTIIFLALVLGFVPYVTNKISNTIKNQS